MEGLEDPVKIIGRDPWPIVPHLDHSLAIDGSGRDPCGGAAGTPAVSDGVVEEVLDDPTDLGRVSPHGEIRGQGQARTRKVGMCRSECLHRLGDHDRQVDAVATCVRGIVAAREQEQIVRDPRQSLRGRRVDFECATPFVRRGRGRESAFGRGSDGGQGRPHLM